MKFKKGVKSIQTAGYNGARTVVITVVVVVGVLLVVCSVPGFEVIARYIVLCSFVIS